MEIIIILWLIISVPVCALIATLVELVLFKILNLRIGLLGMAVIFFGLFFVWSNFLYAGYWEHEELEATKTIMLSELKEKVK